MRLIKRKERLQDKVFRGTLKFILDIKNIS